jgi:uncharacterized protein (TIGR03437 family)
MVTVMGQRATLGIFLAIGVIRAQEIRKEDKPLDWRRLGGTTFHAAWGDAATGPIERAWFTPAGLAVLTAQGQVFTTSDYETWTLARLDPPEESSSVAIRGEEIVEAARDGVRRSLDGGKTWAGLNRGLPGLPVERLLSTRPLRIAALGAAFEWRRDAWAELGPAPRAVRAWADPNDDRARLEVREGRLYRTLDGGNLWDDVTLGLAGTRINGVTAHRASSTVYVATDRGVYGAAIDLRAPSLGGEWRKLTGALPGAWAVDVKLDEAGNQLYAAFAGWGVYAALAPHRRQLPSIVSAADLAPRAAAPGSLMSVLGPVGATVRGAVPLSAEGGETQVQVPFDARGRELALTVATAARTWNLSVPLERSSPAIFEREGQPMVLDGDSGVLIDALTPLRSGMRIQLLATGLGRVSPEWPAGVEAPFDAPPRVVESVAVLLDRLPLAVTRATLAPGYIGFYLVEAQLPDLADRGTAELTVISGGRESNRVRVYIEP